ncbi:MAG: tol-pal system protein YbgF [Rhodospirillaceae bacterium]|nr:tol-pal system protein YbgF [Rhodospirillaceae bacterium]
MSAFKFHSSTALMALTLLAGAAQAQTSGGRGIAQQQLTAPGAMEEAANLQVRVLKLEQLVEQLTGQLEEARFRNRQLTTQLESLSNDLNYRLAVVEQSMGGKVPLPAQQRPTAQAQPARPTGPAPAQTAETRGPATIDPNAPLSSPVAPQPSVAAPVTPPPMPPGEVRASTPGDNTFGTLVTDASGRALPADPNAPVAMSQPPSQTMAAPAQPAARPAVPAPQAAPNPPPVAGTQLGAIPAGDVALPEGTPKQQYDFAFDFLKRQDYGRAEASFREFLKRYPKDPLSGNAQYWLGETHYVRGDYQKAAVEFMNGYQNYPKSNKAPDNLLKLGMSMAQIGQGQGACTALSRLTKEYPDAGDQIRRSAQQERQKLKCQ